MLACGLHVVSTDAGAIPEFWGKCESVKIIPQNNIPALRCAIQDAMEHPLNREAAQRFIVENYSNEILARKYVEALQS